METIELWPLSQGEIDGSPDGFIDAIFALGPEFRHTSELTRRDYIDRIVRGGFPEAIAREGNRRARFFNSYVADLINRDVMQLSTIQRSREMNQLVRLLASLSGQLVVNQRLAERVGVDQGTIRTYLQLLEEVFLIKRIPAWTRNLAARVTTTPKVAMVDAGVAANLLGLDAHRLRQPEGPVGPLLEAFALMELGRQQAWAEEWTDMYHYRTRDKVEVDIVLENRRGEVVAIEVKAAETVRSDDFVGLRHLASQIGGDLVVGVLLYAGTHTLLIDDKLIAVPLSAIWGSSANRTNTLG